MRQKAQGQEGKEVIGEQREEVMTMLCRGRHSASLIAAMVLAVLAAGLLFDSSSAFAADAPAWNITAIAVPADFVPNSTGFPAGEGGGSWPGNTVEVKVRNLGDTPISGSVNPIKIVVNLQGVTSPDAECVQPS